ATDASDAQRENALDGALAVHTAIGALDRHPFQNRVKRDLGDSSIAAFNLVAVNPAFRGSHQNRQFGGIPDADVAVATNLGITAGRRGEGSPHQSSRPCITPFVSVPVLSVQITVAQPSVSTAGNLRISTWRAAIRCTPNASAIVPPQDVLLGLHTPP